MKYSLRLFLSLVLSISTTLLLDAQTVYTFTPAGATGENGPTQAMVNTAYSSTNLSGKVVVVNGIQYWEVPSSGTYVIEAFGGQGYGTYGGRGAHITGEFTLTGGDTLKILVGQKAGHYLSYPATTNDHQFGGGGGSFVTTTTNTPYIVAGGGGGNHDSSYSVLCDAQITTMGAAGTNASTTGNGGTLGGGGTQALSADGGGGFLGNGTGTAAGQAFVNGGSGGFLRGRGGFGGGGGTSSWNNFRSGGGGGYSGGGGANNGTSCCPTAGGGGSFNAGVNQVNYAGVQLGDGQVIIRQFPSVDNDAGIAKIIEPENSCEGTYDVKAVVSNYGTNQIDSVDINWSINGNPQAPFFYRQKLDTSNGIGASKDTITLGSVTLTGGMTELLKAWTLLPNNVIDTSNNNDTTTKSVLGYAYPSVDLGPDTSICMGEFGVLESGGLYDSARWSTTQLAPSIVVISPGTYSIKVYTNGCESRDTINVSYYPAPPAVNLGPDTTICPDDSLILDATTPFVTYEWKDNSTAATYTVKSAGTYWVDIEDTNTCNSYDTIKVSMHARPSIFMFASPGNSICYGDTVSFTALGSSDGSIMYQWKVNGTNSGSPTSNNTFSPNLNHGDTVMVDLITDLCVQGDTAYSSNAIGMTINPEPLTISGPDTIIENTTATYAVAPSPGSSFKWTVVGGTINGSNTGNSVTVDWGAANPAANIVCEETVGSCTYPNQKQVAVVSIVGINTSEEQLGIGNAFPNPANTSITIPVYSNGMWNMNLDIYDMTGRKVKSGFNGIIEGSRNITIDIQDLKNGMYMYRISTSNGDERFERFVIKR